MKVEIKVPSMGESITEASVGSILKPTGSKVMIDDEILELETDKVNQVLYAPKGGVITLNVQLNEQVKIGQVIGTVETDAVVEASQPTPKIESPKSQPAPELSEKKEEKEAVRFTKEAFIKKLEGDDFKKKPKPLVPPKEADAHVQASQRETRRKMTKIRRVIAERLVEAKQSTAMLTTFNEVDLSAVISLREKYKDFFAKEHGTKLGYMSFFVKATVSALMTYPNVNSYIAGEDIVHREYYDIGIAVGADRGLIVPVVRDCDKLSFAEIEKKIGLLSALAKEGTLSVDDLQGGGFTITNGGTYGSLLSTPILNLPQSAILGMHKIQKRPIVCDDQIVIRPMMYLALSYDHRLIDGKEAVHFLIHIKDILEDPSKLLLENKNE